jgi:hypothetical protein
MALKQADVNRALRPFTLHTQEVMSKASASMERLPAVMDLVYRALEHAGLGDTLRLLPNLDVESAMLGAKSYPETSAQHHALWAAIMMAMVSKKPLEAERYLNSAETARSNMQRQRAP